MNQSRILVVDDDSQLREAIVDTLMLTGYDCLEASSGEDALYQLSKRSVDMVIADIQMDGMDGHTLLRNIRDKYPQLPVLLMTAYANIDGAVRAMREGVDLEYNATTLPAPMEGDGGRIKQVFVNILDNAIKYTGQGGKVLVTAVIDEKKNELCITFADNGCGIPARDLPRVKEKFYKANTAVRGSGIGLAVADEIIRRHGGTLDISSIEGEGTTVSVTLPIGRPAPMAVPPVEEPVNEAEK